MKRIKVDGRIYRVSAQHNGDTDWDKSMPQIRDVIRRADVQRNLDNPRFGCHACGPFHGRDTILIVRGDK